MPLFKKTSADDISLLEVHRKSLRRCRQTFLKDLEVSSVMDFMVSEEGFRQDQRDVILALPSREQQVTAFLDHLESKGERTFALFVEALKTRHKHLHAFLEEMILTVDKWDSCQNSEKTCITGVALREMLARRRHESAVQNGEDGENPAEKSESQDNCCDYIQCYSVTTKGHLQKEKWITHYSDSCGTNRAPAQDRSYMAIITANLIFRRLDWAVTKLGADINKPPNDNIPAYIFEKESNCVFSSATKQLDQDFADSVKLLQKKKIEQIAEETESKTCIPTASIRVRAPVPPPVPPKPATLPVVELQHSPPLPKSHKVSEIQDIVPPIRTTSKISLPNGIVRPPVTSNRQSLQIPSGHSAHSELRTQSESLSSDCESKERRSEVCKSLSSVETNLDDADDEDVDTIISLDYNVSIASTLEPEEDFQIGENDDHNAFDVIDDVKSDGPSENHLGVAADFIKKKMDGQPTEEEEEQKLAQIKQFEQTQEPLKSGKVTSKQMQKETTQDQESHASSCPESENDRICDKNNSEDATVHYDLPPAEDMYDECSSKPTNELLTTNKTHENQNLLISLRSVDQPVFADDEFSSDNSYYEEIEQFFGGCSSPSCQSYNAYLDPRASLLRTRSINRSAHHYAAEELRKQGRKFLCHNSLLLVSHDTTYTEHQFSSDSSDVAEGKIEPSQELDSSSVSDTLLCFDRDGSAFYVPRRFLKKYGDPEGEMWFYPMKISSREAALFLLSVKQEGCFIVYLPEGSSPNVAYNLSLCLSNNDVVHYHILENMHGDYGIEGHDHTFMTVGELVEYFRRNKSSLATRLRRPLRIANHPITPGYHYDICYELNRSDILLTGNILGQGNFGVVCSGTYRNMPVAVKVLQQADNHLTAADEDDFIEEALALMALRHENIIRLIGVSCKMRPYFLVTEYMSQGNLKDCLRNGFISSDSIDRLFSVCVQVVSAMQYLENFHYMLHRDLAARNFLVDENLDIKLADFGRARIVSDDCYQAPRTEKICIKWAAPEVLIYSHYSTKSDVWSFGVVLWEVFSAGARPFSIFSGEQTAMYVTGGGRLDKPLGCPLDLFEVMKSCWCEEPESRPSFGELSQTLKSMSNIYASNTSAQQFLGWRLSAETAKASQFLMPEKNPVQRKSVTSSIFGTTSSRKTTFGDNNNSKIYTNNEYIVRNKNDAQHILNHEGPLSNYLSDFSIATASSEIIDIDREDVSRGDRIRKSLRKLINKKSKTKLNELSGKPVPASQECISLQ